MVRDTGGSLPQEFRDRLKLVLPEDCFNACWESFHQQPVTVFRVNTLKTRPASLLAEIRDAGISCTPMSGLPLAYRVLPDQRRDLTGTAAFADGRLYVQNPSSMLAPLVLQPDPEDRVLDLAAAPGSKTLQLAALMEDRGWISAVESVRSRYFRMRRNLQRSGAGSVRTYLRDGASVWRLCPERFDRVLLDAPCSSEGTFNSANRKSYAYWSLRKIKQMVRKQRRLVYSAVNSLKPGGVLVYATCTFAPEENEGIIDWMLGRFGDSLAVEPFEVPVGEVRMGLRVWQGRPLNEAVTGARRILPDGVMEGFFLCRIRKCRSTLHRSA